MYAELCYLTLVRCTNEFLGSATNAGRDLAGKLFGIVCELQHRRSRMGHQNAVDMGIAEERTQ
ncbi:hypothetical protein GCM10023069_72030 [Shinella granuli]